MSYAKAEVWEKIKEGVMKEGAFFKHPNWLRGFLTYLAQYIDCRICCPELFCFLQSSALIIAASHLIFVETIIKQNKIKGLRGALFSLSLPLSFLLKKKKMIKKIHKQCSFFCKYMSYVIFKTFFLITKGIYVHC